ncbi:MAG: SpoIIE family protein phosphatase [Planctomycetes bacterium]|nr:SpoIIE family protein phosphatase [Planctomycetota bacterium]
MNKTGAYLLIRWEDKSKKIVLPANGILMGRDPQCHLELTGATVSRRHARLYPDPFGRWILEDLKSRYGTWVDGRQVQSMAVGPANVITIRPYTLQIIQEVQLQSTDDLKFRNATTIDDATTEVVLVDTPVTGNIFEARFEQLNRFADRLAEVDTGEKLYQMVCAELAGNPGTSAMILRVSAGQPPAEISTQILACELFNRTWDPSQQQAPPIRISRRVIEAVRTKGVVVRANSRASGGDSLVLTADDDAVPSAVFGLPLSEVGETVDVLYVSVIQNQCGRDMLEYLHAMARQISLTRKTILLTQSKNERDALDRQLAMARSIQTKLTPSSDISVDGVDVAFCYKPAMWVGGDYCDLWLLPDKRLAFAVGDVSGKGLPAAMIMSNLQAALRATCNFCPNIGQAMTHVNSLMRQNMPESMFITLFVGVIEPVTGRLDYVNAGHLQPFLVDFQGHAGPLETPRWLPIGLKECSYEAELESIPVATGVVCVTDGITEAATMADEQFGDERLKIALERCRSVSAKSLVGEVSQAVEKFQESLPPQDDFTIMSLVRTARTGKHKD